MHSVVELKPGDASPRERIKGRQLEPQALNEACGLVADR
jgi:hypothetical protein